MKLLRFFTFSLVTVILLSACSSDDDNSSLVPANASGVGISYGDIAPFYLWINDYVVNCVSYEESEPIGEWRKFSTPYYPLSMKVVYQLLSDREGTIIDESNYSIFGFTEVDYCKNHLSTYKYIVLFGQDIILFNRISSENY